MPIQILLIEDNPGDVRLMQEAFRDINPSMHLNVACDGVEAMAFLRHEDHHVAAPRPDLILLDLNLPKMSGREVLGRIKADESLKSIPTVIVSTSETEEDIAKSYQLRANCYVTKPVTTKAFTKVLEGISTFWLTHIPLGK
jgi:chemotaxis family two-component system response regulator Rcp1